MNVANWPVCKNGPGTPMFYLLCYIYQNYAPDKISKKGIKVYFQFVYILTNPLVNMYINYLVNMYYKLTLDFKRSKRIK